MTTDQINVDTADDTVSVLETTADLPAFGYARLCINCGKTVQGYAVFCDACGEC